MLGTLESRSNSSIKSDMSNSLEKEVDQVNHCFTVCHNSYHYYNTIDNEKKLKVLKVNQCFTACYNY